MNEVSPHALHFSPFQSITRRGVTAVPVYNIGRPAPLSQTMDKPAVLVRINHSFRSQMTLRYTTVVAYDARHICWALCLGRKVVIQAHVSACQLLGR